VNEKRVRLAARKIEAALSDYCYGECASRYCEGCPVDAALRYVHELMLPGSYREDLTAEQQTALQKPCKHLVVLPGGRR